MIEIDGIVLFLILSSVALLGWYALVHIIPRDFRECFEIDMWRIRDDLYDRTQSGEIEDNESSRFFVSLCESRIDNSSKLTFFNLALTCKMPLPRNIEINLETMDSNQSAILRRYYDEMNEACIAHVFFGTPSGWLFLLPSLCLKKLKIFIGSKLPSNIYEVNL